VTSAADAFGSSVGNERVGIYNAFSARGFSPVQAGNVRLEGLYFDLQTGFSNRLISGINMRVGISAQGYPISRSGRQAISRCSAPC
jgi:iron complex outermembrane recepter protein